MRIGTETVTNLRLDLAYDGTPFHGFARQPDVRTVQGEIEDALSKLFAAEVATVGAGRTDAGVHALGQVMSLAGAPEDVDCGRVRDALNAICGPEIAIWDCRVVAQGFHARFNARSRGYVYSVLTGDLPDPFLARTTWYHPGSLDVEAMREAAGHLLGPHDFTSFGRVGEPDASAERIVHELAVEQHGRIVRFKTRANSFIQQMVRSIVGTLVQVGEGKKDPDAMVDVLAARDRAAAGPVAPPHGLCLVTVEYDDGWSRPFDPFDLGSYPAVSSREPVSQTRGKP